jgi:hypothetical protein
MTRADVSTTSQAEQESRLLLAIQKPTITDVGGTHVTVEFNTGPNVVTYDFTVSCYKQDLSLPTNDCGAIENSDPTPLGSLSGTLPTNYSNVVANVTGLTNNTDVDCFAVVGNGPLRKARKCQYVGQATTDVLPPGGDTSAALTDVSGEILVKTTATKRKRAYDVTNQVQCVPAPVTGCDKSDPTLWFDAPNLYTSGKVIQNLTPNTYFTCFAAATYVKDGVKQYECAAAEPAELLMPPLPPSTPTVAEGPAKGSEIVVTSNPPSANQGTAEPLRYAVQCLDATTSTPNSCDPTGIWSGVVTGAQLSAGVTVSDLVGDTEYVCFAAAVYDSQSKYACSGASAVIKTALIVPGAPTIAKQDDADQILGVKITWTDGSIGAPVESYKVDCTVYNGGANTTPLFETKNIPRGTQEAWIAIDPSALFTCYVRAYTDTGKYNEQVSNSLTANYNSKGFCTDRDAAAESPLNDDIEPTKEQIDQIIQTQIDVLGKPVSQLSADEIVAALNTFRATVPICYYVCEPDSFVNGGLLAFITNRMNIWYSGTGISFTAQETHYCGAAERINWVNNFLTKTTSGDLQPVLQAIVNARMPQNCLTIFIGDRNPNADFGGFAQGFGLEQYSYHFDGVDQGSLDTLAVHEAGHNFGLYHTFANNCAFTNGQSKADVPLQIQGTTCIPSTDTCPSNAGLDPINNFMAYSPRCCRTHFSPYQAVAMQAEIQGSKPQWVTI